MPKYIQRIKDWPEEERPRERLIKWGADKLTEAELLAIVLRMGFAELTAIDLARHLLQECGGFRGLDSKTIGELCEVKGIGPTKAAQIKAALEIGKRATIEHAKEQRIINESKDIDVLMRPYLRDLTREVFKVLLLTSRNALISERTVFEGSLTESMVHPREVIKIALDESAARIVFVHNHPSGNPSPSMADKAITNQLVSACKLMNIDVLDHVIIGKQYYYSFADEGLLG
ncbi:DNA repair protein RadC [candidate division KSB1 bacterium]|nr:DNA repair protein RadC [candidate division KSB1 bacterium]